MDWAHAVADALQEGAPGGGFLRGRRGALLAAAIVALAALAAYSNSFRVPLLLDDSAAITTNPAVRSLAGALAPPPGTPVSGRPLLSLTFALNYAAGGLQVGGYHAINLLVHVLCALVLMGLVRRTLEGPVLSGRFGADSRLLSLLVAVLWAVHPLQTEAVTYVSQRAESLMALFYLLTLYLFAVGQGSPRRSAWLAASVLACLMGALTKEIIATAPLLVLLYDRTFCAGSLRSALRMRWRYYLALASSWVLLAALSAGHGNRGVGFGTGVGPWDYALTSCRSLATYLRLALWPHPLVFDYGMEIVRRPADVWPQALFLAALLAIAAAALVRRPAAGFLFAWFFVVLAPTTSIVPVAAQPIAEHRAYLPLAAVACALVLGLYRACGRRYVAPLAAAALLLGFLAHQRNGVYRSEASIWTDTLAKRPGNARAHCAYGFVLSKAPGSLPEAIAQYREAVRLDPGYVDAHVKLGIALAQTPGSLQEAVAQLREALRLDPRYVRAHDNLGTALAGMPGRLPEAISEFEAALKINPRDAQAHNDLGLALAETPGRMSDAVAEFEAAIAIDPDLAQAHNDLGVALAAMPGRLPDAISQYLRALEIDPQYAEAHTNLGIALAMIPGRLEDAVSEYRAAIALNPAFAPAHNSLGAALSAIPGRAQDAIVEYEAALRLKPDYAQAHNNLGLALARMPGRLDQAIAHFEEAIRIDPGYAEAHANLGLALCEVPGRLPQAIGQLETALRLSPADAAAHNNLGIALANTPGRLPEALAQFQEALRLRPDYADARRNLQMARQMLGQQEAGRAH